MVVWIYCSSVLVQKFILNGHLLLIEGLPGHVPSLVTLMLLGSTNHSIKEGRFASERSPNNEAVENLSSMLIALSQSICNSAYHWFDCFTESEARKSSVQQEFKRLLWILVKSLHPETQPLFFAYALLIS